MKALAKRYLALILSVLMVVSMIGTVSFADPETGTTGQGTDQTQVGENRYSYSMTVGDEISFTDLRTEVGITDTTMSGGWGDAPDPNVIDFNNSSTGTVKAVGAGSTAISWDNASEQTYTIDITVSAPAPVTKTYNMTVGGTISFADLRTAVGITDTSFDGWGDAPDPTVIEFNNSVTGTVTAVGAGTAAIEWDGTSKTYIINITVTEAPTAYTATFMNGETPVGDPVPADADGKVSAPTDELTPPAGQEGKEQDGWYDADDTQQAKVTFPYELTSNKTFQARWVEPEPATGWDVVIDDDQSGATITCVDPSSELNGKSSTVSLKADDMYYLQSGTTYVGAELEIKAVGGGDVPEEVTSLIGVIKCGYPGWPVATKGGEDYGTFAAKDKGSTGAWARVFLPADEDEPDVKPYIFTRFNMYRVIVEMNEPEGGFVEDDDQDLVASATVTPQNKGATFQYCVDDPEGEYSESAKNTGIEASETPHKLYYQLVNDDGLLFQDTEGLEFTVSAATSQHHWAYKKSQENSYTAEVYCDGNDVCDKKEGSGYQFSLSVDDVYSEGTTPSATASNGGFPDNAFTLSEVLYYNEKITSPKGFNGKTPYTGPFVAGDYTARVIVNDASGEGYSNLFKNFEVKHVHAWTYTGEGQKSATCTAEGQCDYHDTPVVLGVTVNDKYYLGDTVTPTAGVISPDSAKEAGLFTFGTPVITKDGKPVESITEAGHYTVTCSFSANGMRAGQSVSNDFEVVDATVTAATGLVYNDGNPLIDSTQTSLAPADTDAYLVYSMTEDGQYTTTIPVNSEIDPPSTTVYYKVVYKDDQQTEHTLSGPTPVTVTISKPKAEIKTAPTGINVEYNGGKRRLFSSSGTSDDGTVMYSGDPNAEKEDFANRIGNPAEQYKLFGRDAKEYTLYYYVKGDAYHADSDIMTITATISQAEVELSWNPDPASYQYDGSAHMPTPSVTNLKPNSDSETGKDVVGLEWGLDSEEEEEAIDKGSYTAIVNTLTGEDSKNYKLSDNNPNKSFDFAITAKPVTVTVAASDKTYDGNAVATLTGEITGVIEDDDVEVAFAEGAGTFNDKNVGDNKPVTIDTTKVSLSGEDVGNYELTSVTPAQTTASITSKTVKVTSGITGVNKEYNATNRVSVNASEAVLDGVVTGETVGIGVTSTNTHPAGLMQDKNVGNDKEVTIQWQDEAALYLTGDDAANYTLDRENSQPTTTVNISKREVTVTNSVGAENKVYDGNTEATLTVVGPTINRKIATDDLTIAINGKGTFDSKDVGEGKTVTFDASVVSLTGNDKDNYELTGVTPTETKADITKKELVIDGLMALDKPYDGNANATLQKDPAIFNIEGLVGDETVSLYFNNGAGTFVDDDGNEDPSIGDDKTVEIDWKKVDLTGDAAGNYVIDASNSQATTKASISGAKVIKVTSGITAENKTYDGNTDATLDFSGAVLDGLVDGDDVSLAVDEGKVGGVFDDKNIGDGKPVTIQWNNIKLVGEDADGYILDKSAVQLATTANITPKEVDVRPALVPENKVYDGTTDATMNINTQSARIDGAVNGDDLWFSVNGKGSFSNKNVGNNKTVTYQDSIIELTGEDAGNYVIDDVIQPGTLRANITRKDIAVSGIKANDKPYDGNRSATLDTSEVVFDGLVEGDELTISFNANAAEFENSQAGTDKTVNITWGNYNPRYTLGGADADNYRIPNDDAHRQRTTTASITKAKIAVTAGVVVKGGGKVYDGDPIAKLDVDPDAVQFDQDVEGLSISINGYGIFVDDDDEPDKNVGEDKKVVFDPEDIVLTGNAAANYELDYKNSQSSTKGDITPRTVTIDRIDAKDKTYDGTTDAVLDFSSARISEVLLGDYVDINDFAGATFSDKNAGHDKTVSFTIPDNVLKGADSVNYVVDKENSQKTALADINPRTVVIQWQKSEADPSTELSYVYNASEQKPYAKVTNAVKIGETTDDVSVSVLGGQTDVGKYTAKAGALSGADKGNYKLDLKEEAEFEITPKPVTLSWTLPNATVEGGNEVYYNGKSQRPVATVVGAYPEDQPVYVYTTTKAKSEGKRTPVDADDYTTTAYDLDDDNYVFDPEADLDFDYTIMPLPVQLQWKKYASDKEPADEWIAYTYNGKEQCPVAIVGNLQTDYYGDLDECDVILTEDSPRKDVTPLFWVANSARLTNPNYTLVGGENTWTGFSIDPYEVTEDDVTWAQDPDPFVYDGQPHQPTATIKGLADDGDIPATVRTDGIEDPKGPTDAGEDYIAKITATNNDNYKLPEQPLQKAFDIKKAELTATADDQTIYTGEDFDKTKVTYKGFAEGDDESVLDPKAEVKSPYFKNAKAGTYKLTPEGAKAKNYDIKTVAGKLTVKKKVTWLVAKAQAKGATKAKLTWNKPTGAKSYDVYINKCNTKNNKYKPKYVATVKTNTYTKKGLKKGKCYKYYIVAKDAKGNKIAKSKTSHVAAGNIAGKLTNAKSVKVNKTDVSLAAGQKFAIKASQSRAIGGKTLLDGKHVALFRYTSTNKAVATVSKKGVITAKGAGYCEVYVQAANGLWKTVKVTVK